MCQTRASRSTLLPLPRIAAKHLQRLRLQFSPSLTDELTRRCFDVYLPFENNSTQLPHPTSPPGDKADHEAPEETSKREPHESIIGLCLPATIHAIGVKVHLPFLILAPVDHVIEDQPRAGCPWFAASACWWAHLNCVCLESKFISLSAVS